MGRRLRGGEERSVGEERPSLFFGVIFSFILSPPSSSPVFIISSRTFRPSYGVSRAMCARCAPRTPPLPHGSGAVRMGKDTRALSYVDVGLAFGCSLSRFLRRRAEPVQNWRCRFSLFSVPFFWRGKFSQKEPHFGSRRVQ